VSDETGSAPVRVELEDLASEELGPKGSIKERGTFLQRAGVSLFYWVFGATILVLLTLTVYTIVRTPTLPPVSTGTAADTIAYRLISAERQVIFDNYMEAVQAVIVAVLLPLLTAILGYLFGTAATEKDD
jgi:hypothetical protein